MKAKATVFPNAIRKKSKPNYGVYYLKPYMVMLACFLAFGAAAAMAGLRMDSSLLVIVGLSVMVYGVVTIAGWALARYVIPGSRTDVARNAIDLLRLNGSEKVLDAGSGRGIFAIEAAKKLTSGEVAAIDLWEPEKVVHIRHRHTLSQPSENTVANAMRNASIEGVSDRIRFINMDANHLEFAPGTFDAVICGFIVGHQGEYSMTTLKEVRKVLKSGGKLLLIDNFRDFTYFLLSTPHLFVLSLLRGTKARRLALSNWRSQVEGAGFRIVDFKPRRGILIIRAVKYDE